MTGAAGQSPFWFESLFASQYCSSATSSGEKASWTRWICGFDQGSFGPTTPAAVTPGSNDGHASTNVYGRMSDEPLRRSCWVAVANHSNPCLVLSAGQMNSP